MWVAGVRKNAVMVLTHLILNDMMKVKGHIARMVVLLQDPSPRINELAHLFFQKLALKNPKVSQDTAKLGPKCRVLCSPICHCHRLFGMIFHEPSGVLKLQGPVISISILAVVRPSKPLQHKNYQVIDTSSKKTFQHHVQECWVIRSCFFDFESMCCCPRAHLPSTT